MYHGILDRKSESSVGKISYPQWSINNTNLLSRLAIFRPYATLEDSVHQQRFTAYTMRYERCHHHPAKEDIVVAVWTLDYLGLRVISNFEIHPK